MGALIIIISIFEKKCSLSWPEIQDMSLFPHSGYACENYTRAPTISRLFVLFLGIPDTVDSFAFVKLLIFKSIRLKVSEILYLA